MTTAPDYQTPQPGHPDAMQRNMTDIGMALHRMSTDVPEHLEAHPDAADAAELLNALRDTRKQLADLEAFTEAECAKRFGKGKHKIPGWQVEVKGGSDWKEWRHDDVAFALCRPLAVDEATGEIVPEIVQIIDLIRTRLLEAARPSWRTTVLHQYGIAPSDYATWTPSRKTVALTPDSETAA